MRKVYHLLITVLAIIALSNLVNAACDTFQPIGACTDTAMLLRPIDAGASNTIYECYSNDICTSYNGTEMERTFIYQNQSFAVNGTTGIFKTGATQAEIFTTRGDHTITGSTIVMYPGQYYFDDTTVTTWGGSGKGQTTRQMLDFRQDGTSIIAAINISYNDHWCVINHTITPTMETDKIEIKVWEESETPDCIYYWNMEETVLNNNSVKVYTADNWSQNIDDMDDFAKVYDATFLAITPDILQSYSSTHSKSHIDISTNDIHWGKLQRYYNLTDKITPRRQTFQETYYLIWTDDIRNIYHYNYETESTNKDFYKDKILINIPFMDCSSDVENQYNVTEDLYNLSMRLNNYELGEIIYLMASAYGDPYTTDISNCGIDNYTTVISSFKKIEEENGHPTGYIRLSSADNGIFTNLTNATNGTCVMKNTDYTNQTTGGGTYYQAKYECRNSMLEMYKDVIDTINVTSFVFLDAENMGGNYWWNNVDYEDTSQINGSYIKAKNLTETYMTNLKTTTLQNGVITEDFHKISGGGTNYDAGITNYGSIVNQSIVIKKNPTNRLSQYKDKYVSYMGYWLYYFPTNTIDYWTDLNLDEYNISMLSVENIIQGTRPGIENPLPSGHNLDDELIILYTQITDEITQMIIEADIVNVSYWDGTNNLSETQAIIDDYDFMTSRIYLNYSNGLEIWANFGTTNYTVVLNGQTINIPKYGLYANQTNGSFEQAINWINDSHWVKKTEDEVYIHPKTGHTLTLNIPLDYYKFETYITTETNNGLIEDHTFYGTSISETTPGRLTTYSNIAGPNIIEDFEQGNTDEWTIYGNTADMIQQSSTCPDGGDFSYLVNGTGTHIVYRDINPGDDTSLNITISFKLLGGSGVLNGKHMFIGSQEGTNNPAYDTYLTGGSATAYQLKAYNGGTANVIYTVLINTWYNATFEIDNSTGTWSYYLDGVNIAKDYAYRSTMDKEMNNIYVMGGANNYGWELDNIIRNGTQSSPLCLGTSPVNDGSEWEIKQNTRCANGFWQLNNSNITFADDYTLELDNFDLYMNNVKNGSNYINVNSSGAELHIDNGSVIDGDYFDTRAYGYINVTGHIYINNSEIKNMGYKTGSNTIYGIHIESADNYINNSIIDGIRTLRIDEWTNPNTTITNTIFSNDRDSTISTNIGTAVGEMKLEISNTTFLTENEENGFGNCGNCTLNNNTFYGNIRLGYDDIQITNNVFPNVTQDDNNYRIKILDSAGTTERFLLANNWLATDNKTKPLYGIYTELAGNCDNCTIKDNHFSGYNQSIYALRSNNLTIENNTVNNSWRTIYNCCSNYTRIINNTVNMGGETTTAIFIWCQANTTGNNVTGNIINSNNGETYSLTYGTITLDYNVTDSIVEENTINDAQGQTGIMFPESRNNTANNNTMYNVYNCFQIIGPNIIIKGNYCYNSTDDGVQVSNSGESHGTAAITDNLTIQNNTFEMMGDYCLRLTGIIHTGQDTPNFPHYTTRQINYTKNVCSGGNNPDSAIRAQLNVTVNSTNNTFTNFPIINYAYGNSTITSTDNVFTNATTMNYMSWKSRISTYDEVYKNIDDMTNFANINGWNPIYQYDYFYWEDTDYNFNILNNSLRVYSSVNYGNYTFTDMTMSLLQIEQAYGYTLTNWTTWGVFADNEGNNTNHIDNWTVDTKFSNVHGNYSLAHEHGNYMTRIETASSKPVYTEVNPDNYDMYNITWSMWLVNEGGDTATGELYFGDENGTKPYRFKTVEDGANYDIYYTNAEDYLISDDTTYNTTVNITCMVNDADGVISVWVNDEIKIENIEKGGGYGDADVTNMYIDTANQTWYIDNIKLSMPFDDATISLRYNALLQDESVTITANLDEYNSHRQTEQYYKIYNVNDSTWYNINSTTFTLNRSDFYDQLEIQYMWDYQLPNASIINYTIQPMTIDTSMTIQTNDSDGILIPNMKYWFTEIDINQTNNPTTILLGDHINGDDNRTDVHLTMTLIDLDGIFPTQAHEIKWVNESNKTLHLTMTGQQVEFEFDNATNGEICDINKCMNWTDGETVLYVSNLSQGLVKSRFCLNETGINYTQYYEYINDGVTGVDEKIHMLLNRDTSAYFRVVDEEGNPMKEAKVRAYHIYSNETFEPYNPIGQRLTDDDGYTVFIFDSLTANKIVTTKNGYTPDTKLMYVGDETAYTRDTAITIYMRSTGTEAITQNDTTAWLPRYYWESTTAIQGVIYNPSAKNITLQTNYRKAKGYGPKSLYDDGYDRWEFTLTKGTDFGPIGAGGQTAMGEETDDPVTYNNIEINWTIDGILHLPMYDEYSHIIDIVLNDTYGNLSEYQLVLPYDERPDTTITKILAFIALILISFIIGMITKDISPTAGTHTFMAGCILLPIIDASYIALLVIAIVYFVLKAAGRMIGE